MKYEPRDYSSLFEMEGFSEDLLKNHFHLYEGYVKNTNYLLGKLDVLRKEEKAGSYEYGELKRRLGWEWNGMRLHELYFDNLGGKTLLDEKGTLVELLRPAFGGLEQWKQDFKATGGTRGIGWVVLYLDTVGKRAMNSWINEHDTAHLAGCRPLVVMDVWEHAFMLDYQLDKSAYMEAFLRNVDWDVVTSRLQESGQARR